ncbi:MAG: hypothetical protein KatS3mg076_2663 [Candidatus Binatia bacterium]|nr:MAG: hypothetical protein KatS3mg076_2663 [Candidatus Binatia bacterium]
MPRRRNPFRFGRSFGRRRVRKGDLGDLLLVLLLVVFLEVVLPAWPLWVLGLVLLGGVSAYRAYLRRLREERRLRALTLADVDRMDGRTFERYVARLYSFYGYRVERTGGAGDQGCDLVLEKDGRRIACQVKRYRRPVPNDAVAEAVAAKALYGCQDAMVVTTSYFTRGARELARANGCLLVDRDTLGELVAGFQEGGAGDSVAPGARNGYRGGLGQG